MKKHLMGGVTFDGPAPAPTFKEQLERKIAQKREFIEKYPNYAGLCDECREYIKWAEERLAVIAEQERTEGMTAEEYHQYLFARRNVGRSVPA